MDLRIRQYLTQAQDKDDPAALRRAYATIKDAMSGKAASDPQCFLPELYVLCAEQALVLGCREITEDCLMMYLESKPPPNQFLCRAYFCQAQLNSPRTVASVEDMDRAVTYYLKAIEISKEKPRYHFLVFNASVLYFQTVRAFLRPCWRRYLVSSLTQVLSALEEVAEPDYIWRAELMMLLVKCLVDAGKKNDAADFSKVTSKFIQQHTPELYPQIFSIQMQHDLIDVSNILTKARPQLLAIYKLQKLKKISVNAGRKETDELREIFVLLTHKSQSQSSASNSLSIDTDDSPCMTLSSRIDLLLQLAFLSLHFKEQIIVEECIKELKNIDETAVGKHIMVECVECELVLMKQNSNIEDYTKSSVEAQLRVVTRLEALLLRAVREGDAQVTQSVCAALWNSCLPLLQHNLRKNLKSPLLTLSKALEDINSMLLDMRCQVHAELAAIEEEAERLEPAIQHLHAALGLDENGQFHQRLSFSLHRLQLRSKLYSTPTRPEDQAAMLIQQTKEHLGNEPAKNWRPILVSAGIALAPDTFQMVLDADSTAKGSGRLDTVEQLAAKAKHYSTCVQKVECHFANLERDTDDRERIRLWASLVKAARKQVLWDVCRAACRFCLLYDDKRWKIERKQMYKEESGERELLRLLAEVHFINAEATIHKLRSEGVELNDSPVPPVKRGMLTLDDPQWTLYSDWIQEMSDYATTNLLRGAELGAELQEPWLVVNAAVYLWNYNNHILAAKRQNKLVTTFSQLVELLRQTGHEGEVVLLVLLCDAVAQGIIKPWCGTSGHTTQQREYFQSQADKTKKSGKKGMEKSGSTHSIQLEAAVVQDIKKALQMCDYALRLSNGNDETVPIMVRKQLISTWVNTKRLLQQQIGQNFDIDDECKNEALRAMSRVLVGVEMMRCNTNHGLMEFTVPSLTMLIQMASDCKWSDPVVELYAWSNLARFANRNADHDLVMTCTQNSLQLDQKAKNKAKISVLNLYSLRMVQEMLSTAACLRGLSMLHKSCGHFAKYTEALAMLHTSISYAEQAGSWPLCRTIAKHYWNSCLALIDTPEQRHQLQKPLELVVKALTRTYSQPASVKNRRSSAQKQKQPGALDSNTEDDLAVRAAMYSLLFQVHVDCGSLRNGLQVLDLAIREMPRSPHRLTLYKQQMLVKAQLGESIELDMHMFTELEEVPCAMMWHHVALATNDIQQKMHCYQNAINELQSAESQWKKVDLLLEYAEWLYCNNFPVTDVQLQTQSAIDILLSSGLDSIQSDSNRGNPETPVQADVAVPVSGPQAPTSMLPHTKLNDVHTLDMLVQAYTLLAIIESRVSTKHLQYLVEAYHCVVKIWQVSMKTAQEVIKDVLKNSDIAPQPVLADSSKKDKEKEKEHEKIFKSKEKKPKVPGLDASFQLNPEKWSQFECPEEFRQAFKHDRSPYSINRHSISMQNRTLFYLDLLVKELESVSLTLLTLPPLHLAEVIAHDLLLCKSHSDLYRLRILKTCCELGLDSSSPYNDALLSFAHISEDEQILCRKTVALKRERTGPYTEAQVNKTQETAPPRSGCGVSEGSMCRKRLSECTVQNLLMDKAAVCISMGLYQPARRLLAEAHLVAKELGDKTILARCFYHLAVLASHEQQHGQALALVEQAQEIGGDEEFWYNLILSLLNTTVQIDGDNIYTQVCKITDTAIGLFRSALEQKPNRASVLNFYIASLQARGAVLCRQSLRVTCPGHSVSADTVKKLNAVCDTLKKSAAALRQHGYKNQAAETILEQAHTLRMLAMVTSIKEEKQQHLLDALSLIQQAVALQEEVLSDCLRLIPTQEGGWRRLPAMRVSVCFRLALADLGLLMLEMFCEEEKVKATIQIRMSSTERAVDSYLKSSPELNALQREWLTMGQSVGQLTFTQLSVVQSLIKDCVETRMQTLGMLGKCLRLLALQRDPLYPNSMWDKSFMVNIAGGKETECKNEDENVESSSLVEGSISQSDNTIKMEKMQNNKRAVQQMLIQASDTLTEALSLGLQQSLPELLSYVCEEMLESHSQNDTAALGQYLALLQSCVCCTEMSRVLGAACWDSSQSQVAALLGLQKSLKFSQHSHSRLLSATDHSLKTLSKAYQHVNINPKHLSLLGELPSNLKILLLQHSKDGSVLYGAFYEKAQSTESHKFKSMQIAGGLVCSKVTKAQVQPTGLLQLRHQTQAFRQLAAQTIIKESCRLRNAVQTKDCIQLKKNTDQELREHFQAVVKGMEDYLHPLLSQFDFSCFRCPRSIVTDEATQPKDKEEREATDNALPEHGECVVVLADTMLLELPLEALRVLRGSGISSISRDFSLQVFHSRLHGDEQVESDSKTERKSAKTAKGKGDQSKAIKVAPVRRVLPADTLSVDSRKFKYFVDPHSDGVDNRSSPAETMRKILDMYSQQFTAQWEGVVGSKQPCRSQDLEHLLTNCSCFIYCGEDRFLNHISPDRFANLNLSECELAVIFDPVHNGQSMWLQSHWDIQKCKAHLALESPVECAYLLTLSGVHAIMLNQWSSITRANAHNMETIMEHLLQTGLTSGQAVHTLRKKASLAQKEPDYALEAEDEPGWILPSAMNFIIYGLPNLIVT